MTFGSLFAGIGGFDLGLERAGMRCVWQVEIDEYCRRVLTKHWPSVRRWDDVRTFPTAGDWRCDLICGGFPCQPVSQNGKKQAQKDARWLWPDFHRIICTLRPRFALLENVPGLLDRGIDDVLGDLAAIGYDSEWDCLPAAIVGAEHLRDRVWIIAYATGEGPQGEKPAGRIWGRGLLAQRDRWSSSPRLRGNPDGVPHWVDRIRALGNAVVPQVAELIGRQIMESVRA